MYFQDYIHNFLFHGHEKMGEKTFLDYFPQYRTSDGKLSIKRSVSGRKYEKRPWDEAGNFIPEPDHLVGGQDHASV
jgi:phytochromobilin:ferredoxin oxidoreductase